TGRAVAGRSTPDVRLGASGAARRVGRRARRATGRGLRCVVPGSRRPGEHGGWLRRLPEDRPVPRAGEWLRTATDDQDGINWTRMGLNSRQYSRPGGLKRITEKPRR